MCFEIFHILIPIASRQEMIAVLDVIPDMPFMEAFRQIREAVGMDKAGYAAFFEIIAYGSTGQILGLGICPRIEAAGRNVHKARRDRRKQKMLVKRHGLMMSGIFF